MKYIINVLIKLILTLFMMKLNKEKILFMINTENIL